MKKILCFLLLTSYSYAVLPPAWESVREIKAILEDPYLTAYLNSGDLITSIDRSDEGWMIKTNHSSIKVEVKKLPQSMPGPEQFELHFSKML